MLDFKNLKIFRVLHLKNQIFCQFCSKQRISILSLVFFTTKFRTHIYMKAGMGKVFFLWTLKRKKQFLFKMFFLHLALTTGVYKCESNDLATLIQKFLTRFENVVTKCFFMQFSRNIINILKAQISHW